LIGLHALPASLISPEADDLPDPLDGSPQQARTIYHNNTSGERVANFSAEAQGLDLDNLEPPLPSLGYLDEALSYIATERMKWRAAQGQAPSAAGGGSYDLRDGAGSGDDGEGQEGDAGGDGEWRNVVGMF
jgi:hypothetical protein